MSLAHHKLAKLAVTLSNVAVLMPCIVLSKSVQEIGCVCCNQVRWTVPIDYSFKFLPLCLPLTSHS